VQCFSLSFFDQNKTGNILSIMINDINLISNAFNKSFHIFFHEIISMLILFIMLYLISPSLTFIIIIAVPFSAFIIIKISQSIKRKAKRASFQIADILSIVEEKIIGVKIVKAFNMTKNEINNFISNNFKFYSLQFNQQKLYGLTTPVNDIIGVVLASILLIYGGQQVLIEKHISPDDFMRFIIFLFAMLQPARKLGNGFASLQTGLASSERLFDMIDYPIEKDGNYYKQININKFNECIEFTDLSFQYENSSYQALKNINVKINKGEKVALIGRSGSGKTTFSNLLLKFYNSTNGSIKLDDNNYNNINSESLRNLIGLVPQDAILFNDTISNNISYGKENINPSNIITAAKAANIHDFIISLKDGYDTVIGERGARLSGGQKQRISIARAILKNPLILIFDEATSSLDSESEQKVQIAINNLVKDRTVIMIAHRLSTIKNADNILVFDNGEIKEEGNHNKLIKKDGLYKQLHDLQLGKNSE
jgi:subfamily B ATP-binding cassette protein MsbA